MIYNHHTRFIAQCDSLLCSVSSHLFCTGIQWTSVQGLFVRLLPGDICNTAVAGLLWLLTSLKLSRRRRRHVFDVGVITSYE